MLNRTDIRHGIIRHPKSPRFALVCLLIATLCRAAPAGEPGAVGDLYVGGGVSEIFQFDITTAELVVEFTDSPGGRARGLIFGPNGNLFVSGNNHVYEFDGQRGDLVREFVSAGAGTGTWGLTFGPNGNLFVTLLNVDRVDEFDGNTGAFVGTFASGGGLDGPASLVFGPNGNLFVTSAGTDQVLEYDGVTGAFVGVFAAGGGLDEPQGLVFGGPNGNLFVVSSETNQILEYDGSTGAFVRVLASTDLGQGSQPFNMILGPNGNLFIADRENNNGVLEFDPDTGAFIRKYVTEYSIQRLAIKPPCPSFTPVLSDFSPGQGDNCGVLFNAAITGTGLARACAEVKLVKAGEPDIIGDIVDGIPLDSIGADFDLTGAAAGMWDLIITYPDLQTDTLVGAFEVIDGTPCGPPTVTDASVTTAMNCGNLRDVVITGTNFTPGTTVKLVRTGQPEIAGSITSVALPTEITADFALADVDLGTWDLVVTNEDLQSATLPGAIDVTQCLFGVPGDLFVDVAGTIFEFDGASGELIGEFTDVLRDTGRVWLPNGNFAAGDANLPQFPGWIEEYDGRSGELLGNLVEPGTGGLIYPSALTIGPNGNLFALDSGGGTNGDGQVLEYDIDTGAFVQQLVDGGVPAPPCCFRTMAAPRSLVFGGPNDNLFVGNPFSIDGFETRDDFISEFDGLSGALVRTYGNGDLQTDLASSLAYLAIGPDGSLFAAESGAQVLRFDPATGESFGDFVTPSSFVLDSLSPRARIVFGGPNDELFVAYRSMAETETEPNVSRIDCFDPFVPDTPRGLFATVSSFNDFQIQNLTFKPMVGPFPTPQLTGLSVGSGMGCGVVAENVAAVTLTGTDLLPNFAKVRLSNGVGPDVIGRVVGGTRPWVSPSEVEVEFDLTGVAAGTYDVVFNYPDGGPSDTLTSAFTVNACPAPTLTAVDPSGPANCPPFVAPLTTKLTVFGTGIVDGLLAHPTVRLVRSGQPDIDGTLVKVESSTEVSARFDLWKAAPGAWDVVLTNPDGQSATLPGGVTIGDCVPAPVAISPASAENCDHLVDAAVTGSGFIRGTRLTLTRAGEPDIDGITVDYVSGGELRATFDLDGATPGLWSLVATNPDGQSNTLADALTIIQSSCPAPLLRVRVTEIYSEFEPLPEQPNGERVREAVIGDDGAIYFTIGPSSACMDCLYSLYRRDANGSVERLIYDGQLVDDLEIAFGLGEWWAARDGFIMSFSLGSVALLGPGQPLQRALTKKPLPSLPGLRFHRTGDLRRTSMIGPGGGHFAATVVLNGVGVNPSNDHAILGYFDGALEVMLREGDLIAPPMLPAQFIFDSHMGPRSVNANGWLAARVGNNTNGKHILVVGPGHDLKAAAWHGQQAHGLAPGVIYSDSSLGAFPSGDNVIRINDAGKILYVARVSDGRYGLWTGQREAPELVAITGDPAPGGGTFNLGFGIIPIFNIALNNRGDIALLCDLTLNGTDLSSIWLGTNAGDLQRVMLEGDPAFNGPNGETLIPSRLMLNDRGDLLVFGEYPIAEDPAPGAVWLRDHRTGRWFPLIQSGETIDGRFIRNIESIGSKGNPELMKSLNNNGSVVIRANDAQPINGSEVLYQCDLVPAGDINGDGFVDGRDIQPFVDLMLGVDTDPDRFWAADMVVDDVVDFDDLTVFVDLLLERPIMFGDAPVVNQVFFGSPTDNCPPTEQFVTVLGTNFQTCSWLGCPSAKLVQPGQPDVNPSQFEVLDPTTITATFPMDDVPPGTWRLVVVNPDGQESNESAETLEVTVCPTGACCLSNGNCSIENFADCITIGGNYAGDDVSCATAGCPVCFSCPGGAIHENEACSTGIDNVNAGCSGSGPENFIPISCGQTVCGESWADGGARDFDWYELNVNEATRITWNVTGDYSFRAWILDGNSSDCSEVVTIVTNGSAPCGSFALTADVTTGRYYLVVGADVFEGHPCSLGPWRYTATVSCQTLTPPANDDCVNAQPVFDGGAPLFTLGASTDGPALPVSCHSNNATNMASDVWYCYTATCTGTVTLSTCLGGADFDTWLAVYDGCSCPPDNNDLLACNDDNCPSGTATLSELSFPVVNGQTYLIRAGGFPSVVGFWGNGFMTLDCQP